MTAVATRVRTRMADIPLVAVRGWHNLTNPDGHVRRARAPIAGTPIAGSVAGPQVDDVARREVETSTAVGLDDQPPEPSTPVARPTTERPPPGSPTQLDPDAAPTVAEPGPVPGDDPVERPSTAPEPGEVRVEQGRRGRRAGPPRGCTPSPKSRARAGMRPIARCNPRPRRPRCPASPAAVRSASASSPASLRSRPVVDHEVVRPFDRDREPRDLLDRLRQREPRGHRDEHQTIGAESPDATAPTRATTSPAGALHARPRRPRPGVLVIGDGDAPLRARPPGLRRAGTGSSSRSTRTAGPPRRGRRRPRGRPPLPPAQLLRLVAPPCPGSGPALRDARRFSPPAQPDF